MSFVLSSENGKHQDNPHTFALTAPQMIRRNAQRLQHVGLPCCISTNAPYVNVANAGYSDSLLFRYQEADCIQAGQLPL